MSEYKEITHEITEESADPKKERMFKPEDLDKLFECLNTNLGREFEFDSDKDDLSFLNGLYNLDNLIKFVNEIVISEFKLKPIPEESGISDQSEWHDVDKSSNPTIDDITV